MAPNLDAAVGGFRRQITFRLGPADAPVLEAVVRAHGGIQAGITAALRAYAAQLLQSAPAAAPVETQESTPAQAGDGGTGEPQASVARRKPPAPPPVKQRPSGSKATARSPGEAAVGSVELNVAEAAPILGVSATQLREAIKRGERPGRRTEKGFYLATLDAEVVRASGAQLSLRGAGELVGLRPGTIRRHCKQGSYPGARHEGGWTVPAGEVLGVHL
jgi:hypothetical protein